MPMLRSYSTLGQDPIVISTDTMELQAGRVLAEDANNKTSRTKSGGVMMPSLGSMVGNKTINFIDQKVRHILV